MGSIMVCCKILSSTCPVEMSDSVKGLDMDRMDL